MPLAAQEWVTSTWAGHKGNSATVFDGLCAKFASAMRGGFDITQYATFGSRIAVYKNYVQAFTNKQVRTDWKRRELPKLRAALFDSQYMVPQESVSVLDWMDQCYQHNHNHSELVNVGVHRKGKLAVQQCMKAAQLYGISKQGLNLVDELPE